MIANIEAEKKNENPRQDIGSLSSSPASHDAHSLIEHLLNTSSGPDHETTGFIV